jgi:hypothetical protein
LERTGPGSPTPPSHRVHTHELHSHTRGDSWRTCVSGGHQSSAPEGYIAGDMCKSKDSSCTFLSSR